MKKFMLACCLTLLLNDCTSLLPRQQATTISQWGSFESARSTFDHIPTGAATTDDLKKLGLDPFGNQNVIILNYSDLARRLLPTANLPADYLDPALSKCLAERELCYAYEIDIKHTDRNRIGSFWLDFFNFHRTTDITGWHFNALFVIQGQKVVYKLWSGQPVIHEVEEERKPLGPLQGIGESNIRF